MATDMRTDHGPVESAGREPSMTALVSGIITDVQQLLDQQFRLLRAEIRRDMATIRQAAVLLLAGAIALLVAAVVLLFGLAYALAAAVPAIPLWGWLLIVGGVAVAVAVVMMIAGVKKFSSFSPLPEESAQALKENVQCMIRTPK